MSKKLIFSILLLSSNIMHGQVPLCGEMLNSGPEIPGNLYFSNDINAENLPYLFFNWFKGSIRLVNGKFVDGIYLQLNTSNNHLIYKNVHLNVLESIDHRNLKDFSVTDPDNSRIRIFRWLDIHNFHLADTTGFFAELLGEGNCSVYALRYSERKSSYPIGQLNVQRYYYYSSSFYYFLDEKGQYIHFRPSNRAVKKMMKKYKAEIANFVRKEHLNSKNEPDLVKVIQYINSLNKD